VLDHQVEEVAAHFDPDLRVGAHVLADVDVGHLDPELLHVAAAAVEVHPDDEPEILQRGHLVEEPAHRAIQQLYRV
jgi:hypothetical protein